MEEFEDSKLEHLSHSLIISLFNKDRAGLELRAILQAAASRENLIAFFICICSYKWQIIWFSVYSSDMVSF